MRKIIRNISLLIILTISPIRVGSSHVFLNGLQTGEEIASGTVNLLLYVSLPPKHRGSSVSFELKSFNVVEFNLNGSQELHAYGRQLQQDINNGALRGQVTVTETMTALRSSDKYGYPAKINVDFIGGGSGPAASSNTTGLNLNLLLNGFIKEWRGIGNDSLKITSAPPITIVFEKISAGSSAKGSGGRTFFKGSPVQWTIPGVDFGGLKANVKRWGNMPSELRSLSKLEVTVTPNAFQYDAASGMVAGKFTIRIKRIR